MQKESIVDRDLENPNNTVATCASEAVSLLRKVDREARSAEILNFETRLERFRLAVTIEYLYLVGARSTCNDKIIVVLLELAREDGAVLVGRQFFVVS